MAMDILVTEVSRLSRLDSDWHRVIELCAVFETLIADEDGLYDPRDPNDRLVLGLKGTLFSAELHILRARMRGGLLNKARRGALALRLPVGFRRLDDGTVVQDPDEQVRTTLYTLFERFAALGSARAVQRAFAERGLQMPRLAQTGPQAGQLTWATPTYQMIHLTLTNPAYAGTFAYGRRVQRATPGDPLVVRTHRRALEEWEIVVPGVYPGYLSAAQYYANRHTLTANQYNFAQRRIGAPREGPGLLVGLLRCGRCGRRMTPSYGDTHSYCCRRQQAVYDRPLCQSFPVGVVDAVVRDAFFAAIQPAQVATILTALDALEQERQARDRQWQHKLERARYAVALAQRQYDACDPDHRLVARELERRWDAALAVQEELERGYAVACRTELAPLSEAEQAAVRQLAEDLPTVWAAPTTTPADRKRLLRLVIQEVTVTVQDTKPRRASVRILWSGGLVTDHLATCLPAGWACRTAAATLARLAELAQTLPDHQVAERLNAEGVATRTGKPWTFRRVQSMRAQHRIPSACPVDPGSGAPRGDGLVPVRLAAQQLDVSLSLIHVWVQHGVLVSEQRTVQSYRWVHLTDADRARLDGHHDWSRFPTLRTVAGAGGWRPEEVWARVRAGEYRAYRHRAGQHWEWRLEHILPTAPPAAAEVP